MTDELFAQNAVKQLTQEDFELDSDAQIKLKNNSCVLVLFYNDNVESKNLLEIWNSAGKQTVGPIFASLNLNQNRILAQAFTNLNMKNTSLHWAALKTIPFILVYQNRWPIGFYNGERSVQDLIDYSLVLACKAEYHEPVNLYGGSLATDNQLMKGVTQYGSDQNKFKHTSLDFTGKENIRGYDPADKPVLAGTAKEVEETKEVEQEELSKGTDINIPKTTPTEAELPVDFTGTRVNNRISAPTLRPAPPIPPASSGNGTTRTFAPSRRAPPPPK